jgi:hypothetical protein
VVNSIEENISKISAILAGSLFLLTEGWTNKVIDIQMKLSNYIEHTEDKSDNPAAQLNGLILMTND